MILGVPDSWFLKSWGWQYNTHAKALCSLQMLEPIFKKRLSGWTWKLQTSEPYLSMKKTVTISKNTILWTLTQVHSSVSMCTLLALPPESFSPSGIHGLGSGAPWNGAFMSRYIRTCPPLSSFLTLVGVPETLLVSCTCKYSSQWTVPVNKLYIVISFRIKLECS